MSKDIGCEEIPSNMYINDKKVPENEIADCFATYFEDKVNNIVKTSRVDDAVYYGVRKLVAADSDFMSPLDIIECVKQLKIKNCEGYDRIPQRILIDGIDVLIKPLSHLFNLIYNEKVIPEQWLISKITPIHKKGSKNSIENYRPVASLCSTTKIFERLILNRIAKLESLNAIIILTMATSCRQCFNKVTCF